MATRHTLDVKFGVQVPTPQLKKNPEKSPE